MSKEVMKKGSGSVALFADDAATGFDNMTQDDLALPYVRILGQLSAQVNDCLLYTSPSPRDRTRSRMPSSA